MVASDADSELGAPIVVSEVPGEGASDAEVEAFVERVIARMRRESGHRRTDAEWAALRAAARERWPGMGNVKR